MPYFLRFYLVVGIVSLVFYSGSGQGIKGLITDESGEALSFVDIYVYGADKGTISNELGEYDFPLEPGHYEIIYNYVGYGKQVREVVISDTSYQTIDIVLIPQALDLNEIVVSANAEDPAYAIIRNARERRPIYVKDYDRFECHAYTKQKVKIINAPERFFGQDIDDLNGLLDSITRNGILYLSEGLSIIYQDPDKGKYERVISSKVSGDAAGYTWNSAKDVSLNPYKIDYGAVGRNLLSPIAPSCMSYYNYELVGTFYDGDLLINKIKLLPKRENDPVFGGHIYIIEDSWRIYGIELFATRKNHRTEIIDTLDIRQTMFRTPEDVWVPYSVAMNFDVDFFGLNFKADMVAFFSQYKFGPKAQNPNFSEHIIMEVEMASKDVDSTYWKELRPVPLTEEELDDYRMKDSLQAIWTDSTRLDSLDRQFNKVDLNDVVFAYKHKNSFTNTIWRIRSPITNFSFDPVQGFFIKLEGRIDKGRSVFNRQKYSIHPKVNYGFADKRWRWAVDGKYHLSNKDHDYLYANAQMDIDQVNPKRPVSRDLNILASLFTKNNQIRWFDKREVAGGISHRLTKDMIVDAKFSHQRRLPEENHTNFSFFFRDSLYPPNDIYYQGDTVRIDTTVVNVASLNLTYYPGTKMIIRPGNIRYEQERLLRIDFHLSHDFGTKDRSSYFTKLGAKLTYQFHMPIAGTSDPSLEFGTYLRKRDDLNFLDYYHFETNNFQLLTAGNYKGFLMMPHFIYSTPGYYIKGEFNHNFEGWIVDKIPLINKLRIKENVGIRGVYLHEQNSTYWEWNVGIHRFGWRYFKFIRLDYCQSYFAGERQAGKFLLGADFRF